MKIMKVLVAILLAIALIVGVVVLSGGHQDKTTINNMFTCTTSEELENYAKQNNWTLRNKEGVLHLHNAQFLDRSGYCVAEFNADTLKQMTFYTQIKPDEQAAEIIESVKKSFLEEFGFEGEYAYYSVGEETDNVGEADFLAKKATKELLINDGEAFWSVSWLVTDEGVSGQISKKVLD